MLGAMASKRRPLTRRRILKAAVTLVERDGIDGLTMRRLGAVLKVEAMSIYEYVESKDDLLDGIAEVVLEELRRPRRGGNWKTRLRANARAWADLAERHPESFRLIHRAGVTATPAGLARIEDILDALRDAGFDRTRVALAYRVYSSYVDCAASTIARRQAAPAVNWPPSTDVDAKIYPRLAESRTHAQRLSEKRVFSAGLEALLDGLEQSRRPPSRTQLSTKQAGRSSTHD